MRKSPFIIIMCALLVVLISGCQESVSLEQSISREEFIIGTIVSIQIFGTKDDRLLDESFDIIEGIDKTMSLTIEDTELWHLNRSPDQWVDVSDDLFQVIEGAVEYAKASDGVFDVTLQPVIELWGIGSNRASVPSEKELLEALSLVDYSKIQLDEAEKAVYLPKGTTIDLGGIGKGFAADKVANFLKDEGIEKAILNFGGNVLILGSKSDGIGFNVGVQDPNGLTGAYYGVVEINDKAFVTSGIYERNFEEDGVFYHHILDVDNGYPVDNEVAGVSVITEKSVDADALSTILFIYGVEKGLAYVEMLQDVECIYVTKDYRVYRSSGVDIRITDEAYELKN